VIGDARRGCSKCSKAPHLALIAANAERNGDLLRALETLDELLGHATMEMTTRYAHLSPDVPRQTVKLLDGLSDSAGRGDRLATEG
jgi:integrase